MYRDAVTQRAIQGTENVLDPPSENHSLIRRGLQTPSVGPIYYTVHTMADQSANELYVRSYKDGICWLRHEKCIFHHVLWDKEMMLRFESRPITCPIIDTLKGCGKFVRAVSVNKMFFCNRLHSSLMNVTREYRTMLLRHIKLYA
jgi:hypothetical protein